MTDQKSGRPLFSETDSISPESGELKKTLTLNEKIKRLSDQKGLTYKPWETPPWDMETDEPCPYRDKTTMGAESWPKMQKLRAALIADLSD
jgi:hypothetical protein